MPDRREDAWLNLRRCVTLKQFGTTGTHQNITAVQDTFGGKVYRVSPCPMPLRSVQKASVRVAPAHTGTLTSLSEDGQHWEYFRVIRQSSATVVGEFLRSVGYEKFSLCRGYWYEVVQD